MPTQTIQLTPQWYGGYNGGYYGLEKTNWDSGTEFCGYGPATDSWCAYFVCYTITGLNEAVANYLTDLTVTSYAKAEHGDYFIANNKSLKWSITNTCDQSKKYSQPPQGITLKSGTVTTNVARGKSQWNHNISSINYEIHNNDKLYLYVYDNGNGVTRMGGAPAITATVLTNASTRLDVINVTVHPLYQNEEVDYITYCLSENNYNSIADIPDYEWQNDPDTYQFSSQNNQIYLYIQQPPPNMEHNQPWKQTIELYSSDIDIILHIWDIFQVYLYQSINSDEAIQPARHNDLRLYDELTLLHPETNLGWQLENASQPYYFLYWKDKKTNQTYPANSTIAVTSTMHLYPIWGYEGQIQYCAPDVNNIIYTDYIKYPLDSTQISITIPTFEAVTIPYYPDIEFNGTINYDGVEHNTLLEVFFPPSNYWVSEGEIYMGANGETIVIQTIDLQTPLIFNHSYNSAESITRCTFTTIQPELKLGEAFIGWQDTTTQDIYQPNQQYMLTDNIYPSAQIYEINLISLWEKTPANNIFIKHKNKFVAGLPYIKVQNQWKIGQICYIKQNGQWKTLNTYGNFVLGTSHLGNTKIFDN